MNAKTQGEIARLERVLAARKERLANCDRDAARVKKQRTEAVADVKERLDRLRARAKTENKKETKAKDKKEKVTK